MSEVKITALENAPLEVDGACAVLASDGTVVKVGSHFTSPFDISGVAD